MVDTFWLSDAQFERISCYLPRDTRGVARVDDRRVISGIIHVLQSGCRWKDAPDIYGPSKTLYNRFVRWAEKGVWDVLFYQLTTAERLRATVTVYSHRTNACESTAGRKRFEPIRTRLAVRMEHAQSRFGTSPSNMVNFDAHGYAQRSLSGVRRNERQSDTGKCLLNSKEQK